MVCITLFRYFMNWCYKENSILRRNVGEHSKQQKRQIFRVFRKMLLLRYLTAERRNVHSLNVWTGQHFPLVGCEIEKIFWTVRKIVNFVGDRLPTMKVLCFDWIYLLMSSWLTWRYNLSVFQHVILKDVRERFKLQALRTFSSDVLVLRSWPVR